MTEEEYQDTINDLEAELSDSRDRVAELEDILDDMKYTITKYE